MSNSLASDPVSIPDFTLHLFSQIIDGFKKALTPEIKSFSIPFITKDIMLEKDDKTLGWRCEKMVNPRLISGFEIDASLTKDERAARAKRRQALLEYDFNRIQEYLKNALVISVSKLDLVSDVGGVKTYRFKA